MSHAELIQAKISEYLESEHHDFNSPFIVYPANKQINYAFDDQSDKTNYAVAQFKVDPSSIGSQPFIFEYFISDPNQFEFLGVQNLTTKGAIVSGTVRVINDTLQRLRLEFNLDAQSNTSLDDPNALSIDFTILLKVKQVTNDANDVQTIDPTIIIRRPKPL
ncbi:hypothetical protein [Pseudoalteromonas luteoviolacea]|uniref:Uncharacterized protein n=1 Tax=Pseudoalteromonas luteoviolacea DSM 6061 TaxID=1365250 RepID=A0A166UV32_9GAMM|nr:hypothetical protein [Pseudoalteromonas luteoviolacea]KZN30841.1 hypothetical protein N475_24225 [Pseudoalteromonas luteoviolacea DSM 6061]KZN53578.1 hypothetical protein N474_19795 [Pseudoalteromonas luteoviolacea CPMOR-2]MBE0386624.1 hypothetical protein [Pseudoalteromonas luteoviolacea DSM 6061]TQF71476.1 hypothetical protein FLM44_10400 [Pseudoalteromonas luteoviolacea]